MRANVTISPVLCATGGAVFAYYCLFPLYRSSLIGSNALLALAFVPAAALCFFWVLVSFPVKGTLSPQTELFLRLTPVRLAAFAAGLALGIGFGSQAVARVSFGIPENTVRAISGVSQADPVIVSGGSAMTAISLQMSTGADGVKATARGPVTVFFSEENAERLREYGRGAELYAEGLLRKGSGAYTFTADSLHVTRPAPPIERLRTGIRLNLSRRFGDSPWGGLALALLIGIRDNLDTGIASLYRDAGCSHILALSGMHLAVLVALISFLLKRALGLRLAAIAGAFIILVYCFIVGPLPSLNRAALMYLLGVLAVLGMLKREPLPLLCMAFLLQLAITPQAGLSLSFILSYLALAGILTIGVMLNNIFRGIIPPVCLSPLAASAGAFIAAAGVTSWFFGTLRPAGIIASIILTPLTTAFMIGSMAWLGLDMAVPPLAAFLTYPLSALYSLMEKTASIASYIPGIRANPFVVIVLSILSIGLITLFYYRRRSAENVLEPFV